ncbi:RNA polymerase sigma factor [Planctobacterium marinum]|uniref:RNA polymerase sigma factor n=1 Tax=Planctobacterium marinum TaxID=1631968 RepID=UPI001E382761|nr:RNA polymerase sigma factor [Planctobacterium marinum]MCC2607387.1 RNA polymerase sigma factor [Planctobacterium marinum]
MAKPSNITDVFLKYRSQLKRAVSGIVSSDEVDDIVQETWLRSYEAELKQEIQFEKTYMLKTARNLALNHVSKASEKHNFSMEELDEQDAIFAGMQLERQVESKERFLHFCRATDHLSPEVKRVFLLKKVYELSQREIADYLQISESTVEKHVAKGLHQCANYLKTNQATGSGRKDEKSEKGKRSDPKNNLSSLFGRGK